MINELLGGKKKIKRVEMDEFNYNFKIYRITEEESNGRKGGN
jgi:hypothetical protein